MKFSIYTTIAVAESGKYLQLKTNTSGKNGKRSKKIQSKHQKENKQPKNPQKTKTTTKTTFKKMSITLMFLRSKQAAVKSDDTFGCHYFCF